MTPDEMHEVFKEWNEGELDSYLIEITRDILAKKDDDGTPLVDKILDTAGQKGTGKWTVISSQDMGIPITLIAEAVYSRCVSAHERPARAGGEGLQAGQPEVRRRPRSSGSTTSARRSTPRRSSATRRATCSCARRPSSTAGTSTTAASR